MPRLLGAAATALVVAAAFATTAPAKTFKVTRTSDPVPDGCKKQDCSLREAVQAANARAGKDTIVLPSRKRAYRLSRPNTDIGEDAGLTGDLDVHDDPLVIAHPGKGRATIDARGIDRVLDIEMNAPTRLSKLKLVGGETIRDGGAIESDSKLVIKRSVLSRNSSGDDGGAIHTVAKLVVERSSLARNSAVDDGGAIDQDGAPTRIVATRITRNEASSSGAVNGFPAYRLVIVRTAVRKNRATVSDGGGIETGPMTIKKSSVTGNRAAANGGGIDAGERSRIIGSTIAGNRATAGGGVHFGDNDSLRITNSTIAGNRAGVSGGGVMADHFAAELNLNAVTIARNVADPQGSQMSLQGGGLYNQDSAAFTVRNSLIALNRSGDEPNDCEGNLFQSLGNNLLTTRSGGECEGFSAAGDISRAKPRIGKLKRNGGPTKTVSLNKGSPAIGKAHRPSAPKRDQRGVKRDKRPDIGAFER